MKQRFGFQNRGSLTQNVPGGGALRIRVVDTANSQPPPGFQFSMAKKPATTRKAKSARRASARRETPHEPATALAGPPWLLRQTAGGLLLPENCWPEASIVARPIKTKEVAEPRVLVRRRHVPIYGTREEEIVYLPGPSHISLFTGIGGFDIGLEQAGFCTLAQHEMDEAACATLIANRPNFFRHAALIQGDIYRTPTSMLLAEANLRVGECEVVTGGPPCQGFSTANSNSHRGRWDERNDLVFQFLRVVREAQPRFFLFENVPGFVSFNQHEYLRAFLDTAWHDCYYELVYGLLDASDYGVPQRRVRFLCMGTRRDLFEIEGMLGSLPSGNHYAQSDLDRLDELERLATPDAVSESQLIRHPPGIRYFPDRELLIPPKPNHGNNGRSKSFRDFFRRLRAEEPDRVVDAPRDPVEAA